MYGIDMPSRKELVAHNKNPEQIATEIGADFVIYQVRAAVGGDNDLEKC